MKDPVHISSQKPGGAFHPAFRIVIPLLIIAAIISFFGISHEPAHDQIAQSSESSKKMASTDILRSQTIVLPHYQPILPPGPGLETVQSNCLVCHSSRLITDQPSFSRQHWEDTVHKMVNSYGGHVTPEDQAKIVDYLVFIRGDDVDISDTKSGSPK